MILPRASIGLTEQVFAGGGRAAEQRRAYRPA